MTTDHHEYSAYPWITMHVDDLTTPRHGRIVMGGRWWAVTPSGCVLFFKSYASPQCNTERSIVERVRPRLELRWIETAFVPHNCAEYV